MHYVYVLQSKRDGDWYTGYTGNLEKCLEDHNNGDVRSTKGREPFQLIYYEACVNQKDAVNREKYLKSGNGKKYLRNRLENFNSLLG